MSNKMRSRPLNIIIVARLAAAPWQGGATWAVLQYVLGLQRLGHRVQLVEPIAKTPLRDSENATYFQQVVEAFSLQEHAALLSLGTRETVGLPYERLAEFSRSADLLLNISGIETDEALTAHVPVRAYVDLDPGFTQLWHAVQGIDMRFAQHTHFVTIGLGIGQLDCPVPTCGLHWITTPQPIVLEHWPAAAADEIRYDALTTIGNWRAYGSIEVDGVLYGQKVHSLRNFFDLPTRTSEKFALAMSIHEEESRDLAALRANGWQLLDPVQVCNTPARYRDFVRGSKAEFGIAKSGYVHARCGWFSDRSLCYLASGRPVIAQQTGFSSFLPTGRGLLGFENTDDVLNAIDLLNRDYAGHARAARAIAETYFDSDKVLRRLLEKLEVG